MSRVPPEAPGTIEVLRQAGSENFPVASPLFPAHLRPHLMNIYGFARLVDDIGDEAAGDRATLLDWLDSELDAVYARGRPHHPLMERLAQTVGRFDLPRAPFDKLVQANRQDQVVNRYATFKDLAAYCALSANPVGELVLRICGAASTERLRLSDSVCTGLQLVEFWQDLGEDSAKDRVYVPLEDLNRFGVGVDELMAGEGGEPFLRLMRFEAERTRELLVQGRVLGRTFRGRLSWAIRMFAAGGLAALADLERRGFEGRGGSVRASRASRAWTLLREAVR